MILANRSMIVEMNEKKVVLQNLQMEISYHSNNSYVKRKNPSIKKALIYHDLMLIFFNLFQLTIVWAIDLVFEFSTVQFLTG